MAETYKWRVLNQVVQRLSDNASIPNDAGNKDWQAFQSWIGQGNTAQAADLPPSTAQVTADQRTAAVDSFLNDSQPVSKIERAIILTIIDELNVIRQWMESLKAANGTAGTYAALKTGINGLPAMPDRTPAQAKTAVQNKINAGTAD